MATMNERKAALSSPAVRIMVASELRNKAIHFFSRRHVNSSHESTKIEKVHENLYFKTLRDTNRSVFVFVYLRDPSCLRDELVGPSPTSDTRIRKRTIAAAPIASG